jgi:hypothetical protein
MWRLSRRDTSVSDWCERKQILHDSNEDQELPPADAPNNSEEIFEFSFKALNKVLQHTLFEFHDQHRRNINKLWAARDQLEGMMEQYKTYKNTKKYPKFLAKMDLPQTVIGKRVPQTLDAQGRTFGEFLDALDANDIDHRIEVLLKAKSEELDILKKDASRDAYAARVSKCIEDTFATLVEMDFQDEFRRDLWETEVHKFVAASHEHLLFGKAVARNKEQQKKQKIEENRELAKQEFDKPPKELQLDLMIESKVLSMMKGGGKANTLMQRTLSEPAFARLNEARKEFAREHGKFFGMRRDGAITGSYQKGKGKGIGRSREPSTKSQKPRSQSTKGKGKGKGKGKKGFSRNSSRGGRMRSRSKGQGKHKSKQSHSTSKWTSRNLTPRSRQHHWGPGPSGPSRPGQRGKGGGTKRWQ